MRDAPKWAGKSQNTGEDTKRKTPTHLGRRNREDFHGKGNCMERSKSYSFGVRQREKAVCKPSAPTGRRGSTLWSEVPYTFFLKDPFQHHWRPFRVTNNIMYPSFTALIRATSPAYPKFLYLATHSFFMNDVFMVRKPWQCIRNVKILLLLLLLLLLLRPPVIHYKNRKN